VALSGPVPPWQGEAPEIRDPALPRVLPAPVAPPETRDPVLPRPVPSGPGQSALPPPIVDPTGVPGDPSIGPRLDPIELPGGDQGAQMAGEIAASIRALLQGRGGRAGRRISAR
jgi:hypothetical protein